MKFKREHNYQLK